MPCTASSTAAVSRTDRDTTSSHVSPPITSPNSGPDDTRARVGLRPTSPHSLAGMRIDPPPSLAWPMGTSPAATAAADPPLEPPVERVVSQGLRVGPYACGSVVGRMPSSGVFVLPTVTRPAARKRAARAVSAGSVQPRSLRNAMPSWKGSPAECADRSLSTKGTPRKGPSGRSPAAAARARSKSGVITALSSGSTRSMRLDGGIDQLRRAGLARSDQVGLGGGVEMAEVVGHRAIMLRAGEGCRRRPPRCTPACRPTPVPHRSGRRG